MDCPRCRQAMRPDPEIWACPDGHGFFADGDTMQDVFGRTHRYLRKLPTETDGVTCPDCAGGMRVVRHEGHHVDVCPQCTGLWMDPGEDVVRTPTPASRTSVRQWFYEWLPWWFA